MALKDFKVKSDAQMLGNITVDGYLAGPSNFVIDPASVGDDTGTVEVKGNLQVNGTTTTVNSTTLDVADLNITVAKGAANAGAADGAGLTVDGASATLIYSSTNDNWEFNKDLNLKTSDGAILKIQTSDTDVESGNTIGTIEFSAPDEASGTDAILPASSITTEAVIDFASSSNRSIMKFSVSNSGNPIERLRINHDTVDVMATGGVTDPVELRLVNTDTFVSIDQILGKILWQTPEESSNFSAIVPSAAILARAKVPFNSGDNSTDLEFGLGNSGGNNAESNIIMKLNHDGNIELLSANSKIQFVDANESVGSDGTNLILTSGGTAFKIPTSDGTVGQALTTDSNGALSFNTISGAYDLAGGVLTIDADGDTTIDASVDDKLNLSVGALGDISFNYGGNGAETYKFEMSGATFSTTPGSVWPKIYFKRNYSSDTPAAGDKLGQIQARGEDDVGNAMTYAQMTFEAEEIGNGSERGSMELSLHRNNQLVPFYKADATSGVEQNIFYKDIKADTGVNLVFEGATDNTNETTLTVVDPTSDRTITLPDATGTVIIQDSSNDVTIQADTTTSGVDPTLTLYKNDTGTVTDTDGVAAISFKGTNASSGSHVFGWIQSKIENATAGSEEGHIRLSVAGSNASFQNQAYSQGNGLIIYNDRIEALQNIVATGNVTGEQVISTIATGTAPMTVASTTVVSNLNADQLDGKHASDILLEATALAIALG